MQNFGPQHHPTAGSMVDAKTYHSPTFNIVQDLGLLPRCVNMLNLIILDQMVWS